MSHREARARILLQDWLDKQGHDRCWYYPEIFSQLCDLFEVLHTQPEQLPTAEEFRAGCRRYQEEIYPSSHS